MSMPILFPSLYLILFVFYYDQPGVVKQLYNYKQLNNIHTLALWLGKIGGVFFPRSCLHFKINMSYQYEKSHCGDQTARRAHQLPWLCPGQYYRSSQVEVSSRTSSSRLEVPLLREQWQALRGTRGVLSRPCCQADRILVWKPSES